MGIPGSVVEADLLGANVIHGFQPGQRLFDQSPELVYTIIFACLAATLAIGFDFLFFNEEIGEPNANSVAFPPANHTQPFAWLGPLQFPADTLTSG